MSKPVSQKRQALKEKKRIKKMKNRELSKEGKKKRKTAKKIYLIITVSGEHQKKKWPPEHRQPKKR
jgi:hypothetical protein